jgi:hypothetical protein
MEKVTRVYLLGGITLMSEIVFPELAAIDAQRATANPVTVRLDAVAEEWPGSVAVDRDCFATPSQYFLRIAGIARYLVRDGREVVVCPASNAEMRDVRGYFLGIIFNVLCHQRGLLPLHGSAVRNGDSAVAFLGRSGQGKSSIAAHLAQRGFAVLADDICLIDPEQAEMRVIPTAPWLKLWRDSLETLGKNSDGLERVFTEDDKYRLPLLSQTENVTIRALFLLEDSSDGVRIEKLGAVEAVPLLMGLTHQAYLLEAIGLRAESFVRCSRVASQAAAFRLQRPWDVSQVERVIDVVERFLLSTMNSTSS